MSEGLMLAAGLCLLAMGFAAYFGFLVSIGLGARPYISVAAILLTTVCLTVLGAPSAILGGHGSALLVVAGLLMAPALIGWIIGGSVGLLGRPRAQR